MSIRHILVHVDSGERTAVRLAATLALASRFGARVTALFAQADNFGPGRIARRAGPALEQAAAEARATTEAVAAEAGVTLDWWQLSHGEPAHVIAETVICARYADLVVLGQHDREAEVPVPEDLAEEVILNSGRPVLMFPSVGTYASVGSRVLIAWNASKESARALGDAMPFVETASDVTVLSMRPPVERSTAAAVPPVDIARHLAAHGITAVVDQVPPTEAGTANMILNRAFDMQSDLLVMGAYGHYNFPFGYRGGNTRHILREMTLPVLFAH